MIDLAIIGSGIAGLGAAYKLLHPSAGKPGCRVTIYEQDRRPGGHANTAMVLESGKSIPVDTGFMVFNKVTYPHLSKLFADLAVPIEKTDMSFSMQERSMKLEYAGASLNRLFGQRRNLLNLRFWKMLLQLDRFNKEAIEALSDPAYEEMTLEEYVKRRGYGDDFLRLYLIPMSGSVWSTPEELMLRFPARTLLRFFHNHGFLGMDTQHQWWTVSGGARVYVSALLESISPALRVNAGVNSVRRRPDHVELISEQGVFRHDKVIIATHADQALRILEQPSRLEHEHLSKFAYQPNIALLHKDESVMPGSKGCWASWNYCVDEQRLATTHYWMNSLQRVSDNTNYFVSLNAQHLVRPGLVLARYEYEHPLFSLEAVGAQKTIRSLNHVSPAQTVYFCGSYFKYGFHEDGLQSGYEAAEALQESMVLV